VHVLEVPRDGRVGQLDARRDRELLTRYKLYKIGRYTGPFVATVDVWISEEQSRSPGHTLTGRRDEERDG
jgi:hypothetical protein